MITYSRKQRFFVTALSDIYVPLHRIIPFSNVEGQGNRTSIFLQGCKLNCLYCHNPETIPRYAEGAHQSQSAVFV